MTCPMGPRRGRSRIRRLGWRCCCATGRSCSRSGWRRTTSSTSMRRPATRRSGTSRTCSCRRVRIGVNPAARRARRARLVVLDRGLRRVDHRAADHGVRPHHRGPHVVGHDHLGLRRRDRRAGRPRTRLPAGVDACGTCTSTTAPSPSPPAIDLVPEYRVDGGPWLTLPNLQAVATTDHAVEERQAVVVQRVSSLARPVRHGRGDPNLTAPAPMPGWPTVRADGGASHTFEGRRGRPRAQRAPAGGRTRGLRADRRGPDAACARGRGGPGRAG